MKNFEPRRAGLADDGETLRENGAPALHEVRIEIDVRVHASDGDRSLREVHVGEEGGRA